jgi:hypothetical protein
LAKPRPLRVSRHFKLGRRQPELDFVDVDIKGDVRLFVDPRALRLVRSPWADECVALVQDFFRSVLQAIRDGNFDVAQRMLEALREPNETHLGFSRGRPRGRALGEQSAADVAKSLAQSEAAKSGLVEDLEDTALLVPGISIDIVSDIATNIIREPLIRYTQDSCETYGIPTRPGIAAGPLWDPDQRDWFQGWADLPVAGGQRLLLVPKSIVRRRLDYDEDEYYGLYILDELRSRELDANSELVRTLKSGQRIVTKRDLQKKYGSGKHVIIRETRNKPDLLDDYREFKERNPLRPLTHAQIHNETHAGLPEWEKLLEAVVSLPPGGGTASEYHRAVEKLLTALFYPSLAYPHIEAILHEGRKRVDITYTNLAITGFFGYLANHYPCANIFVECKNYSADPGNPELDQLSGRFSPSRGKVGLLACRRIANRELFMQRCRDTAHDQRGYIIPLDDDDLRTLVATAQMGDATHVQFRILKEKFDYLVM